MSKGEIKPTKEEYYMERVNALLEVLNLREFFEYIGDGDYYSVGVGGLLDLYKQEKDSNQWLLKAFDESRNNNIELSKEYCKIQQELQKEREKNVKIQKYVRSNEWAEDYEKSSCRTKILRILEEN